MAEGHRVFLIGGDTSTSPGLLFISVTLLALHLARAQEGKIASPDEEYFFEKHLNAMPRVQEGRTLAERGLATAMIDVSDGLFSSLMHICEETRVGATVWSERILQYASFKSLSSAKAFNL
jgi:thiamine-monophosphate kinase